jgi:hypothetical protein
MNFLLQSKVTSIRTDFTTDDFATFSHVKLQTSEQQHLMHRRRQLSREVSISLVSSSNIITSSVSSYLSVLSAGSFALAVVKHLEDVLAPVICALGNALLQGDVL